MNAWRFLMHVRETWNPRKKPKNTRLYPPQCHLFGSEIWIMDSNLQSIPRKVSVIRNYIKFCYSLYSLDICRLFYQNNFSWLYIYIWLVDSLVDMLLVSSPNLWKRMLLKYSITVMFTCPILSWCKISNPLRENNNVVVLPFPFHIFMSLANLYFNRLLG